MIEIRLKRIYYIMKYATIGAIFHIQIESVIDKDFEHPLVACLLAIALSYYSFYAGRNIG